MAENSTELTVNTNDEVSQQDLARAKSKRMLLSEVYVHKTRKVNTDSENDEQFEVFHIFEFADDPNTKITPKLSTNCTEPRKIIDVLQNSTGSDTPQLQRLIDKLCAQNKRWAENQQTQTSKTASNGPVVDKTASISRTVPTVQAPAPQVNQPNNTAVPIRRDIPIITSVSNNSSGRRVVTTQSASPATTQPIPPAILQPTYSVPKPAASLPPKLPTIRVKALESMKEVNKLPIVNTQPKPQTVNKPPQHSVAKKSVSVPVVRRPALPTLPTRTSNVANQPKPQPAITANQQPVKLWNNVIGSHQKEPVQQPIIRISVNNCDANKSGPTSTNRQNLQAVKNGAEKNHLRFTMKQYGPSRAPLRTASPVTAANANRNNQMHFTMKNVGPNQIVSTVPGRTASPVVENATDNSSTLKINQVFEGVSEDFVEDLLIEGTQPPPSMECPSSLFDDLVKEVATDKQTIDTGSSVKIIPGADATCSDYRCNICLEFSETLNQYKTHMCQAHSRPWICCVCHAGFKSQTEYFAHLPANKLVKCKLSPNGNRSFICIVDPPIILMKNQKVFAFRCKHCKDVAFQNQRNYVQHSQRHAQMFRCKKCPTKPLTVDMMRQHLNHHTT